MDSTTLPTSLRPATPRLSLSPPSLEFRTTLETLSEDAAIVGYQKEPTGYPERTLRTLRALKVAVELLSAVEVHFELVRVRAQPDRVDLVRLLVADPGLDQVRGEDASIEQVVMVGGQVL